MHILLDMDGVLADFLSQACHIHKQPLESVDRWDFYESWGLTAEQFWLPLRGRAFWANLEPYHWARRLYYTLASQYDVTIATSPNKDPDCASGKVDWLYRYFGEDFRDYLIGPEKWLMAKPGHLLIDDNADTCRKFIELGGNAVLFPQPWNTQVEAIPADPADWAIRQVERIVSREEEVVQ